MGTFARRDVPLALAIVVAMTACATPAAYPDGLEIPLAPAGDAARGREAFISRDAGHCVLCHSAPGVEVSGNVGPPLGGVGSRLAEPQLRLRIADISRVNPSAAMPPFHRLEGLEHVAPEYRGKPVLTGQQVEDLVAWLATLK
jgi:sulfur-oxidizing protein SoxX